MDDPTLEVAQNLGAIQTLHHGLIVQAWHKANAREMPGGLAMACLGPVASPEAVLNVVDSIENGYLGRVARRRVEIPMGYDEELDYPKYAVDRENILSTWDELADNDDDWEPPLQTLLYWTEALRREHGMPDPYDGTCTVATEARWLIQNLEMIRSENGDSHWDDFCRDIARARRRLEDVLQDGEREERSWVPCLDCEETRDGRPISVRLVVDRRGATPEEDGWQCPRCDGKYDRQRFNRAMGEALRKHNEGEVA